MLQADSLSDAALGEAFDYCLQDEARQQAQVCHRRALEALAGLRDQFLAGLMIEPDA